MIMWENAVGQCSRREPAVKWVECQYNWVDRPRIGVKTNKMDDMPQNQWIGDDVEHTAASLASGFIIIPMGMLV